MHSEISQVILLKFSERYLNQTIVIPCIQTPVVLQCKLSDVALLSAVGQELDQVL
jgi:hypothetical protein